LPRPTAVVTSRAHSRAPLQDAGGVERVERTKKVGGLG
jgi:hypothetical protein